MFWTLLFSLLGIYLVFDWLIRLLKVGNYSKKYVFVTGCDSGFGRDLAMRLDKMGFPVFAGCLTEGGAKSLSESCSSRLQTLILNVAESSSVQAVFDKIKRSLPDEKSLWAVVNNAGVVGEMGISEMCTKKGYIDTCQVNLFGPIEVSTIFMPLLRKSQGRLVNITSIMGRCPAAYAPYCVSKFGLEAFCDVVRREVARFGVKVSIIEPGYFRTTLLNVERLMATLKDAWAKTNPEIKDAYGEEFFQTTLKAAGGARDFASPDTYKVVDAYVAAITSKYPRPRYTVGYDAKFVFVPLSFLPEWIPDFLLKKQTERLGKNL